MRLVCGRGSVNEALLYSELRYAVREMSPYFQTAGWHGDGQDQQNTCLPEAWPLRLGRTMAW